MGSLDDFLEGLLREGRIVFRGRPESEARPSAEALDRLRRAYAVDRLDIAGPPIPFDERVAVAAAELVRQAIWALVNHDERPEGLQRRLTMSLVPSRPSHHLSADLLMRFLPQIHHRARSFDPADPLPKLLADVLRRWPLSGVLADLDDGPMTSPDFSGHHGLMLLYAERLAEHDKPAWRPVGKALEYVELVGIRRDREGGDG